MDASNIELSFRIIHSVSQLSVYGAVSSWCEEIGRTPRYWRAWIHKNHQASHKVPKTKCACRVEALKSTMQRVEPYLYLKNHEDHIAGKGYNSMNHHNLVHKFILMPQARKILDAKAAVDREWKKLETIPAWQLDKVKSKKGLFWVHRKTKEKSTLLHWWTYVISECEVR